MTKNFPAHNAAIDALQAYPLKPTSLVSYQSNGRVIIISDTQNWARYRDLPEPLVAHGVITGADSTNAASPNISVLGTREIGISGFLGQFQIHLTDGLGHSETLAGDIIVDIGNQPRVQAELPPPGYLHVRPDELDNEQLGQQLLDMCGSFEKPRYFEHDPSICAHAVNGKTVCTRCIDACPADAIISIGETIEVIPQLCQGGGACATACPSGAMGYRYPRLADNGNRIRRMLQAYAEQGGEHAVVVFYCETAFSQPPFDGQTQVFPIAVEEVASVGMDLSLAALAYGAELVALLVDETAPAGAVRELEQQSQWAQKLLAGLGIDPASISLIRPGDSLPEINLGQVRQRAEYSMPDNKRQAIYQAVDHLYREIDQSRELVSLPVGAPFGSATIDDQACTLCLACVSACPGRALQDGSNRELPGVFFIESNCLQCGACTQTCPEQAISILPRFIFDRETRNRQRMLHEDTPFACISCGKPFAPTSVIHKINSQLEGHHMFQTERALDRLKMCEDCRVADIVQDPDAMNGNFDPIKSAANKSLS